MAASSDHTLFSSAVEGVLNSWTVLKVAVENGFGGSDSQEKAQWLVFAINQWFTENKDIESYELEEFLSDVMNTEFDTLVEDGSLAQTSALICQLYRWCQTGQESKVQECLQKLPKPAQNIVQAPTPGSSDDDSEEDADGTATESVSQQGAGNQGSSSAVISPPNAAASNDVEMEEEEEEEDGWEKVRRGKRR